MSPYTFGIYSLMPAGTTKEAIREILRDHKAMIELNPLTFERKLIDPPSFATPEEQDFEWYEIKDHIHYLPCGSIDYHAGFRDREDGLETHSYAPMGVQTVSRWTLTGPEKLEETGMGEGTELDVYLREDVELTCNFVLRSSVQWTFMNAHRELAKRLGEKAVVLSTSEAERPTGRVGET